MKNFSALLLFILTNLIFAQQADNSLQGYYEEKGDQTFYKTFNFDGNGKVLIAGMDYGDYFTRNDSLIIYPDKSIFIFKIKKGKLSGISNWVEKGTWISKKDSSEINNRADPQKARDRAVLLAEYFDKTKNNNELDILFSDEFPKINDQLCDKGLAKACLNLFGMKLLEYTPGVLSSPEKIASKNIKPHPELIALSKKIIGLGEPEGYTVLGSYYYMLGLKDKAFEAWDEGERNGSLKSATTKAMTEFAEGVDSEIEKEQQD